MRVTARSLARPVQAVARGTIVVAACVAPTCAQAQDKDGVAESGRADPEAQEIIITGNRGSAVTDIEPIATLDTKAIGATGATTMNELFRAIRASTQSPDGLDPIVLLNAQRVSGFQEVGTLPPEAVEKIEVLPEEAALKFGYPPTRRVVNVITKRRFKQIEVRGMAGTTSRGGATRETANLGITRLHDDTRLSATLEYRHTAPLLQSSRELTPDPDILFDAVGNVVGANGGEIDPALSALAGKIVTVAPVPAGAAQGATLGGFAAGANQPLLFDIGPYRTLVPRNDAVKGETVLAGKVGKLAGTLSLSAEQSRDRFLVGPTPASLLVPGTNPYSPFTAPVRLDRYLTEAPSARYNQTTTTLHAGGILRGTLAGWRWDFSAALDQVQSDTRSDRGVDLTAANAAIAAGANPFGPLDPALLTTRIVDVAHARTRTGALKAVATNTPIRLPAGLVNVTATVEAERASADAMTRGLNPYALQIGRTRFEGAVSVDVPIASKRDDVLASIGDLSANASVNARAVGGFGALYDTTYGLTWGPFAGVQLLASARNAAAAPPLQQQATPEVRISNVPVFDYLNGQTAVVTLIQGGNPDLLAEHRAVRSLSLNVKPFKARELRIGATYGVTTIRNQTGTVYATSAQTQAILPDLAVRDAAGVLQSVALRPTNFYRERQQTLNLTLSASGQVGHAPKPVGGKPAPDTRPFFYAGMGPTFKFSDRLQLRPGTPDFDLLAGDTVTGAGLARTSGYAYGGINKMGNGMTFDAWYGSANRVRNANPASDLRFAPIFKLNVGWLIAVNTILKHEDWTKNLQLKLDINNLTDAHQGVRDGNGNVPNRYQDDFTDPVGRLVSLSLRKLF